MVLIRHGQSEHHVNGLTGGWTDTPLTELGRRQVALLAGRLQVELAGRPARLVSSDLLRAAQSAETIGQALRLPLELAPSLREINNGVAAGMLHEEARALRSAPTEPLFDWRPYEGSETGREFYARVAAGMEELTREQEGLLLLVSHGGTIIQQVAWWLQLGREGTSRVSFAVYPASLTVLRLNMWGKRTIERLNDTAHLYAQGLAEGLDLGE